MEKNTENTVYIRTADGSLAPFDNIQDASLELARALRLRWGAAARRACSIALSDPIDERRQAAKSHK